MDNESSNSSKEANRSSNNSKKNSSMKRKSPPPSDEDSSSAPQRHRHLPALVEPTEGDASITRQGSAAGLKGAAATSDEPTGQTREKTEEERRLEEKREYNRRNAARARKRVKDQVANLSEKVSVYSSKCARLEKENEDQAMKIKVLQQENNLLKDYILNSMGSSHAATPILSSALPSINDIEMQQLLLLRSLRGGEEDAAALSAFPGAAGLSARLPATSQLTPSATARLLGSRPTAAGPGFLDALSGLNRNPTTERSVADLLGAGAGGAGAVASTSASAATTYRELRQQQQQQQQQEADMKKSVLDVLAAEHSYNSNRSAAERILRTSAAGAAAASATGSDSRTAPEAPSSGGEDRIRALLRSSLAREGEEQDGP